MPSREGVIKILLKSGSFQSGMRRMTSITKSAGTQMGKALSEPMNKGITSAKNSMSGMFDDLKGGLKTAATLGGALSFGVMIQGAAESQKAYISLAHSISTYSGEATKAVDVQKMVSGIAMRTGTSIGVLRAQLSKMDAIPGGLKNIAPALERAAMQTKRLGIEGEYVDSVARTYARFFAKGVVKTAEEAEILTEQINKFGRTILGIDPDEAIDPMDIAEYGSFVNRMNSGLGETNALLGMTGGKVKDMGQAWMFLEEVGLALATTEGLDKLRKSTKLSKKDINLTKGAVENLLVVLEKKGPKAFKALLDSFGPDEAKLALEEVIGTEILIKAEAGKLSKEEWELRIEGIRGELDKAKNAAFDFKEIEKTNNKLMNTASANMNRAIVEVSKAFADPKMLKAINDIAKRLPILAEKVAAALEWIMENPYTAVGAAVGAKIAIPAALAAGGVMGKGLLAAGATKAAGAATVGVAATKAGLGVGMIGAGTVAAAGAVGGAVGGALGYGMFKGAADPQIASDFARLNVIADSLIDVEAAIQSGNEAKKVAALKQIKRMNIIAQEGGGYFTNMTGAIVSAVTKETSIGEKFQAKEKELNRLQNVLINSMKGLSNSLDSTSDSANGAGDNLNKVGKAGGNPAVKGTKGNLTTDSGATGKRG